MAPYTSERDKPEPTPTEGLQKVGTSRKVGTFRALLGCSKNVGEITAFCPLVLKNFFRT